MSHIKSEDVPKDIQDVYMAGKPKGSRWDVQVTNGSISSIKPNNGPGRSNPRILTPSFCHPHIHLDKAFILSHPRYADLEIEKGDFPEALRLTNQAKARFEHHDLMQRGSTLIEESISYGVTEMRCFVEVDVTVGMKALDAGLALKAQYQDRCRIQICVFAQDAIFSGEDGGQNMVTLLHAASERPGVSSFGSAPYVEANDALQSRNIQFAIKLTRRYGLHLDFHIDYNLDPEKRTFILEALDILHQVNWPVNRESPEFRTVVFGHCTRLTLFSHEEWQNLVRKIGDLPVSFVGLPTSDLYMMGRPGEGRGGGKRPRGTIQVPQMIKKYGLNAAIGVNNVGNAFTPHGTSDPLAVASFCVGIYQSGTKEDADILLECISTRAKSAIGFDAPSSLVISEGQPATFIVFENMPTRNMFGATKSVQELLHDGGGRETRSVFVNGKATNAASPM